MRIAIAELPGARLEDWEAVQDRIAERIARAAARGAELLVLPECAFPAYVLGTRAAYDAARRAGLPPPDEFLRRLRAAARRHRLMLCAGFVAEEGDTLRNAAAVIAADGEVCGVRHKAFLWDFDREYFAPADTPAPVDTPCGRVGVLICADARLPEIPAALVWQGATLLVQPTAWVNAGTPERPWNPQPDFLIAARAREFGVPIASASKAGREGAQEFVGGGLVCDAGGTVVARCAGGGGAGVACVDVAVPAAAQPLALTAAQRAALCDSEPVAPAADVPPLFVAPLSEDTPAARRALRGAVPPGALALGIVVPPPAGTNAGGDPRPGGDGVWVVGCAPEREYAFELKAPSGGGGAIRAVVFPGHEAEGFVSARVAALRGAHLVVFVGAEPDPRLLRARACENRVFAVSAGRNLRIIGPSGEVLGDRPDGSAGLVKRLAVADAAGKCVATATDVLRDSARVRACAVIGRKGATDPERHGSGTEFD